MKAIFAALIALFGFTTAMAVDAKKTEKTTVVTEEETTVDENTDLN